MKASFDDTYKGIKANIKKESKAQVVVFRELMLRAHPGLLGDASGRLLVASQPPSPPAELQGGGKEIMAEEDMKNAAIPPEWAFDDEDESGEEMSADDLLSGIEASLPIVDDVHIWKFMRAPGAHAALAKFVDESIADDIERSTASSTYTDNLVKVLFADTYAEDHRIPDRSEAAPGEEAGPTAALPAVPRRLLAVIQTIAVKLVGDKFDVNKFWEQIRCHFPEFSGSIPVATDKPTATSLLQQGKSVVRAEDQAVMAALKSTTVEGYEGLLALMSEYRSSGSSSEESPDPPKTAATLPPALVQHDTTTSGQHDISIDPAALDTTLGAAVAAAASKVIVRTKSSHSKVDVQDEEQSGGRTTRKRATEGTSNTESVVEVKKSKKDSKKN